MRSKNILCVMILSSALLVVGSACLGVSPLDYGSYYHCYKSNISIIYSDNTAGTVLHNGTVVAITYRAISTGTVVFLVMRPVFGARRQKVVRSFSHNIVQTGQGTVTVNLTVISNDRIGLAYIGSDPVPLAYQPQGVSSYTSWSSINSIPNVGTQLDLETGQTNRFALAFCYSKTGIPTAPPFTTPIGISCRTAQIPSTGTAPSRLTIGLAVAAAAGVLISLVTCVICYKRKRPTPPSNPLPRETDPHNRPLPPRPQPQSQTPQNNTARPITYFSDQEKQTYLNLEYDYPENTTQRQTKENDEGYTEPITSLVQARRNRYENIANS